MASYEVVIASSRRRRGNPEQCAGPVDLCAGSRRPAARPREGGGVNL